MSQPEGNGPRFKKLVAEHIGIEISRVTDEADLVDDLGCDSLDVVEIVMATEEEFGIEITDDEAENIHSIGEGIALLDRRLAKAEAA